MRRVLLTLTVLALVNVLGSGVSFADHSWSTYHWARTTGSYTLPVIDSVTSTWQYAFDESLRQWGQSNSLDNLVVATDEGDRTRKRCPMVSGHMRVCSAAYGQNGWLGLASINIDSNGHITQGTAKMNDSYGWYFDKTPGEDNHVMCQEIGHVYGLGHTTEDGSSQRTCMDYSNDSNSQWPNAHDYEQLSAIYAHLDSYSTVADGGSGGGDGGGCNSPPGKGCNKQNAAGPNGPSWGIKIVGNDQHAIFVKPGENGSLWLTHVRWAPGAAGGDHDH